jgi:hypothetical protein
MENQQKQRDDEPPRQAKVDYSIANPPNEQTTPFSAVLAPPRVTPSRAGGQK